MTIPVTHLLYILNDAGLPVPFVGGFDAWEKWFDESDRQRLIALETVAETVRVLTEFVGVNFAPAGDRPLLYETMVSIHGNFSFSRRYATREEAMRGHHEVIDWVETQMVHSA